MAKDTTPEEQAEVEEVLIDEAFIDGALKPLVAARQDFLDRIDQIKIEAANKIEPLQEQAKRLSKLLRAAGLLEPANSGRPKNYRASGSSVGMSDSMLSLHRKTIHENFKEDEFTTRQLGEATEKDLATAKKAIALLRASGEVEMRGRKIPPGGLGRQKSAHYALVGRS